MGNKQNAKEQQYTFNMHIQFIGQNLKTFRKQLLSSQNLKCIKDYWNFAKIEENLSINDQINNYFQILENNKDNLEVGKKESLIIKVRNIIDPEINNILDKMNKLKQIYYMPLVLILCEEEESIQNRSLDTEEYENIDPRLIKIKKFSKEQTIIEEVISPILLRFCSIHNELGDKFSINGKEDFDLIKNYYPFNLNIACIGRIGQGKSTGVNALLKEYKAKESSKGCSQTKLLTFYQVENQPIRILDVPGYEDDKTVKQSIERFQFSREKINRMKDNIHIILYFLSFGEIRTFMELEYLMLDEILKNSSSKIIYVITHSNHNLTEEMKRTVIERINSGIKEMFKNKKKNKETTIQEENENKNEKLFASLNNIVFVNFHKDKMHNYEPFGTDNLFKTISIFFRESDDYKTSNDLNEKIIKERALKLKEEAKEILLSNKIWGAVVGIIPGVDWALQKFVIKKNAVKKVGKVFGIDIKFVNEQAIGNEHTVQNGIKGVSEAGAYIGGGAVIGQGITRASTAAIETAEIGASIALRTVGIGIAAVGCVIGVGLGGYFTHKYCEQLIDKFVDYYIKNANQLKNSYEFAIKYFDNDYSFEDNKNNNIDPMRSKSMNYTNNMNMCMPMNNMNMCTPMPMNNMNMCMPMNNMNMSKSMNNMNMNYINNNMGMNNMIMNNMCMNNMGINNMNMNMNNMCMNNMGINNMNMNMNNMGMNNMSMSHMNNNNMMNMNMNM